MNIFSQAAEHGIQVIAASSQAAKNPSSSIYAFTKYTTEQYAKYYYQANIKVLRFSNVYGGPNYLEAKNSAIACFIKKAQKNEPLLVHGYGSHGRDFIHVDDVSNAIFLALFCRQECDSPVDIGTGQLTSIENVAKLISKDLIYEPNAPVTLSSAANIYPAKDLFGFEAQIKIEDYLMNL